MSDESVTDMTRGVYRRLYAGFTKGQRINRLSLPAEAWFWRVLATVDDFGNGDADPTLCRAATAGRRTVTTRQVATWLEEMAGVGLISFYEVKGERFLHVNGFEERQPAGKNGKRMRRFEAPDSSGAIPVNPVSSSASKNINKNTNNDDPKNNNEQGANRADAKRGTRISENFEITDSMKEFAAKAAPDVDIVAATAEFVDYWRGVAGQRGTKLNWEATWRNRMRDRQERITLRRNGNNHATTGKRSEPGTGKGKEGYGGIRPQRVIGSA